MKRQVLLWTCLILLISGFVVFCFIAWREKWPQSLWQNRPQSAKIEPGFYRVTHVYDGDTILVDMDSVLEKVRFIGVDTPETHDPDVAEQCYGAEATKFTTDQLLNKSVRLESDLTNSNRDRYERLLRYVYAENGELMNKALIKQGFGFAYTRFPFLKKGEFLNAETEARDQNQGLWKKCTIYINNGIYQTTAR